MSGEAGTTFGNTLSSILYLLCFGINNNIFICIILSRKFTPSAFNLMNDLLNFLNQQLHPCHEDLEMILNIVVRFNILFLKYTTQNKQHSSLEINMLNDFKIKQTWNKWQTCILHQNFVRTFLRGSSSSLRETTMSWGRSIVWWWQYVDYRRVSLEGDEVAPLHRQAWIDAIHIDRRL